MGRQKVELIVTAIGVIIFIAVVAGNFKKKPDKAQPQGSALSQKTPVPSGEAISPAAPMSEIAREQELTLQKEREKLDWGRDPFSASKSAKEYQRANLQIKGISLGKNKTALAFINNEIVKKGDTIGEYEITEIQKDKVMLRKGEQSFYLVLPQE